MFVYNNLVDKRKKVKSKFQVNDLVRKADIQETFSKCDTTNWTYILDTITKIISDRVPSYHVDSLPERSNESLLRKTELSMKEKDIVIKK